MGIPGILKEIGKGERKALSRLSIEHLERHNRPLRIAIDAAIWNFQSQSGQGGKNPALRTLFFRLLRLLALPIQPVFVYDGKNKPLKKRGRTVSRYNGFCVPNELSKGLVKMFAYPWHTAPGEAEAECALLQEKGIVDAVMSQDVDAIMFGAGLTLRDWSMEGTRGNKAPTHVNVMDSVRLTELSGLDRTGMILVALLSGGDYDEAGVAGFGATLACEIARAGFGIDLIELVKNEDWVGLSEWRARLQYELETNESGHFKRKHKTLTVPETFPDLKILSYYTNPAVSTEEDLSRLESEWSRIWSSEIDVLALRDYTAAMFDWRWKSGAQRFVRCFAQPIFQDRLRRGTINTAAFSADNITERRQHYVNDGIPELRVSVVPAEVVSVNIDAEEDNPEFASEHLEVDEEYVQLDDGETIPTQGSQEQLEIPLSPSKKRKSPPWDAYALEKWWIPETLLQLGLPAVVEDWHQLQRDIRADPKKFASRKATKSNKTGKQIDASMKLGAIRGFFTSAKNFDAEGVCLQAANKAAIASASQSSSPTFLSTRKEPEQQQIDGYSLTSFTKLFHSRDAANTTEPLLQETLDRAKGASQQEVIQSSSNKQHRPFTVEGSSMSTSGKTRGSKRLELSHTLDGDWCASKGQPQSNSTIDKIPSTSPQKMEAGSSFSNAIDIESSPMGITPSIVSGELSPKADMTNVTQRRSRRARSGNRAKLPSPPTSPSPSQRHQPIETFFTTTKQPFRSTNSGKDCSVLNSLANNAPMSVPPDGAYRVGKTTALTRESLPGTWKEADMGPVTDRKGPRVSYVDLTGS